MVDAFLLLVFLLSYVHQDPLKAGLTECVSALHYFGVFQTFEVDHARENIRKGISLSYIFKVVRLPTCRTTFVVLITEESYLQKLVRNV